MRDRGSLKRYGSWFGYGPQRNGQSLAVAQEYQVSYIMLSYVMLCHVTLYCIVLCCVMLCYMIFSIFLFSSLYFIYDYNDVSF